jgi:predicted ATPase
LTTALSAKRVDDIQIELLVGRRRRVAKGKQPDLVNIADVGFGVSQVLPVLVALLAARPGQLVYLEEPEIHLHPRAQWRLAELLASIASSGPRVVVETHSSLLLRGIQRLVAKGAPLKPEDVALHWFELDDRGLTAVRDANLDAAGAFGDWPVDFDAVELEAESLYLDAAEAAQMKAAKRARAKK